MAFPKLVIMTGSVLAVAASALPAQAVQNLPVDKAALCSASMQIKMSEHINSISDQIAYTEAEKWFTHVGQDASPDGFGRMRSSYLRQLNQAKADGNPQFGDTARGCLTYFQVRKDD